MNEQELGKEIAKLLDLSVAENIKQSTLYRLQSARRAALENCQPALEIMNSAHGASVFGLHTPHFHSFKLLLLLVVLFVFTMIPATYWQFLERGKLSTDAELIHNLPAESAVDDNHELIEEYIDDVLKLVDDLSVNARVEAAPEVQEAMPAEMSPLMSESEANADVSEVSVNNQSELIEEPSTDVRIENEFDERSADSPN